MAAFVIIMLFSSKTWLLILAVSWLPDWNTLSRSGDIRQFKQQANDAFQQGQYDEALVFYRYLYDNLNVGEEEILVNLAHCYFVQKNTKQATALYQIACRSANQHVKSLAWQQLGVLAYRSKRYDWAGTCFKNALKAKPTNDDSRYNYELTQKILSLNLTKPNIPPLLPDSVPAVPPPPTPGNDYEDNASKSSQNQAESDPYSDMGLSKEQAEILLEAMKEAEKQYIQQQKKQSGKVPSSSKPDW